MKQDYTRNGSTIKIDTSKDTLLSEAGVAIMKDRYILKEYSQEHQTWVNREDSPQETFARSATSFASNEEHAQRLYNYISSCWFMPATPILTNSGTQRGMPISCFLNYCEDSVHGILDHHYETGVLSSYGGGVGGDWSSLRPSGSRTSRGNVSTGVIPFICMMDKEMLAFMQGSSRRGSYAAYMSVSHPEIEEFLDIRTPQTADVNRRCLGEGFHHAINIPHTFMKAVESGADWALVDSHTKEVVKSVQARELWMKILIKRMETGEPYLHFTDTSNDQLPQWLKDRGLKIHGSNLCSEIYLPTSSERTAVCCLSSVNLEYFDDWKDNPDFINDVVEFLDNVLEYFIQNAPTGMEKAQFSAMRERSIGLGAMGFYLLLQKKGVPFESPMAVGINRTVFSHIKEKALEADKRLCEERGEAPDAVGYGRRFSHLLAIAPNANISVICGNTSPSIEPYNANAFRQNTMSGAFLIKNKELDRVLKEEYKLTGEQLEEVWQSITVTNGSVQHLSFMNDLHKQIFKTALELDQLWIVEHAAHRQEWVCQGQSVNLFFYPDVHKNYLHQVHHMAWKRGLKGLYYCRSEAIKKADVVSVDINVPEIELNPEEKDQPMEYVMKDSGCLSCEG